MSSHPSNSLVKVFRLMILGSPEAGKTCLCSMFTSHIFFEVYEHTESPQFYMKSVRSDTVPTFDASEDLMELENDEDDLFQKYSGNEKESEKKSRSIRDGKNKKKDSSSQARKSNKSKNKLKKYGVQLVDIPGEIHQQLLPGTKEYTAVESPHMPIHSSSSDETTALLQSGRNKNQRSVEKNRLHDDTEPHAFIVLFDATDKQNSLEKAINIVNRIRKRKDPELRDEPIIFLGNKMDRFPRSKDAKNKVRENSKKLAPLMMKIKENRKSKGGSRKMKGGNDIYYGSVLRNEIWADSKEDEVMTVDQLIHKLVIRCNSSGLGSKGVAYEKRQKKFNEQQAQKDHDMKMGISGGGEHSWCSCNIM